MLKNLVRKFKNQSLNEDAQNQSLYHGGTRTSQTVINQPAHIFRSHCCPHKETTCPHHQRYHHHLQGPKLGSHEFDDKDSGTESDEELEFIETNSTHSVPVSQTSDYYASQQSLSVNSCRSSHCGSPLLGLSDQECNSLESIGSESGINLRATTTKCPQRQPWAHTAFHLNYEYLLNPYKVGGNNRMDTSTTPTMITEELPNHHYHTRQQLQRLKEQISMKNGDILTDDHQDDDGRRSKSMAPSLISSTSFTTKINTDNTAFSPFYRFVPPALPASQPTTGISEKSPDGTEELEEVDSNEDGSGSQDKRSNQTTRRSRSSTLSRASVISSSGVSTWSSSSSASSSGAGGSEKRKWSQMRQQQQQGNEKCECCCFCMECGNDTRPAEQQRIVLQAARKTPVKLLYPLSDRATFQQQKVSPNVQKKPDQTLVRVTTRQRKKIRGDSDCKSVDLCEYGRTDDSTPQDRFVKRPSLDFDKMRAKRVEESGKVTKKTKRSCSLIGSTTRVGLKDDQYGGYHLRSTRRRHYLFRPLDPATIIGGDVGFVNGGRNLNAESATWFTQADASISID